MSTHPMRLWECSWIRASARSCNR